LVEERTSISDLCIHWSRASFTSWCETAMSPSSLILFPPSIEANTLVDFVYPFFLRPGKLEDRFSRIPPRFSPGNSLHSLIAPPTSPELVYVSFPAFFPSPGPFIFPFNRDGFTPSLTSNSNTPERPFGLLEIKCQQHDCLVYSFLSTGSRTFLSPNSAFRFRRDLHLAIAVAKY